MVPSVSVFIKDGDDFLVARSILEAWQEEAFHLLFALAKKEHKAPQKEVL